MAKKKTEQEDPKKGTPVKPYGRMFVGVKEGGPMWLRENVGTAKSNEVEYELTLNAGGFHPIVASSKTGKRFVLTWQDIVNMAQDAGIDHE